jgi:hypothetical protein
MGGDDFIETSFVPAALVHLVDRNNQLPDAQRLEQQRVLSRLPTAGEPSFELAHSSIHDKHGSVRAAGTSNHVGHKVLVPGSIEYCNLRERVFRC